VDVPLRLAAWLLSGVAPQAVLLYQFIALAVHLFSHANWQLPATIERRLRWWLVTPDFHVVHHSRERIETDSNYGPVLPGSSVRDGAATWRGRLPIPGARARTFRDDREVWLDRLLVQPVREK